MESKLQNDRKTLGTLILYEILKNKNKKHYERKSRRKVLDNDDSMDVSDFEDRGIDEQRSIWETFQNLSKVIGDDFMAFPDFEHFYLKLEKGECELDYDGKSRKSTSDFKGTRIFYLQYLDANDDGRPTSNLNLCDMPAHIIKLISKKLTSEEKWILRETSSTLRMAIDPCTPENGTLEIEISYGKQRVTFKGDYYDSRIQIDYYQRRSKESGELEVYRSVKNYSFENNRRTVEASMLRDIRHLLKKPKTRLVNLAICSSGVRETNSFIDQLKPLLKSQENVQSVFIYSDKLSHFHSVLSSLKPETLEEIELSGDKKNMDLSGITGMDQLRQAKRVKIMCFNASYPLSHLMHLEEFVGRRLSLEPEEVFAIKEKMTQSGNMKMFRIQAHQRISIQQIHEVLGPLSSEFNDSMNRRHFRIHNSDEFMKLEFSERGYFLFSRETTIEEPRDRDPLHIRFLY